MQNSRTTRHVNARNTPGDGFALSRHVTLVESICGLCRTGRPISRHSFMISSSGTFSFEDKFRLKRFLRSSSIHLFRQEGYERVDSA